MDLRQRLEGEGPALSFDHHRPVVVDEHAPSRSADRSCLAASRSNSRRPACRRISVGLVGMDIDQLPLLEHEAAQIVDAVDMVGMRMRVDDRVDAA